VRLYLYLDPFVTNCTEQEQKRKKDVDIEIMHEIWNTFNNNMYCSAENGCIAPFCDMICNEIPFCSFWALEEKERCTSRKCNAQGKHKKELSGLLKHDS
jgi:hypothetical protein